MNKFETFEQFRNSVANAIVHHLKRRGATVTSELILATWPEREQEEAIITGLPYGIRLHLLNGNALIVNANQSIYEAVELSKESDGYALNVYRGDIGNWKFDFILEKFPEGTNVQQMIRSSLYYLQQDSETREFIDSLETKLVALDDTSGVDREELEKIVTKALRSANSTNPKRGQTVFHVTTDTLGDSYVKVEMGISNDRYSVTLTPEGKAPTKRLLILQKGERNVLRHTIYILEIYLGLKEGDLGIPNLFDYPREGDVLTLHDLAEELKGKARGHLYTTGAEELQAMFNEGVSGTIRISAKEHFGNMLGMPVPSNMTVRFVDTDNGETHEHSSNHVVLESERIKVSLLESNEIFIFNKDARKKRFENPDLGMINIAFVISLPDMRQSLLYLLDTIAD